jgi:hypothetical protein
MAGVSAGGRKRYRRMRLPAIQIGRDSDPGVLVFDITADGFDLNSLTIL